MNNELIKSLIAHAHGEISYHKANVNVYLNNPVGIGEHSDIMGAITNEIEKIACLGSWFVLTVIENWYFLKSLILLQFPPELYHIPKEYYEQSQP